MPRMPCVNWPLVLTIFVIHHDHEALAFELRLPRTRVCAQAASSPNIQTNDAQRQQIDNFQPFRFRANNYGVTKFTAHGFYESYPIINVKIGNGALPDTLAGGYLPGFYSFHQSFFATEKHGANSNTGKFESTNSVHSVDAKRYSLEMWNIYRKKNSSFSTSAKDSVNAPSSANFVSINILFQVGNKSSSRLNPFISAIEYLELNNSYSHPLPYNYDPYALLPRKDSFIIYYTNVYPFPYPDHFSVSASTSASTSPRHQEQEGDKHAKGGSTGTFDKDHVHVNRLGHDRFSPPISCDASPFMKVHIFRTPVQISHEQLKRIKTVEAKMWDEFRKEGTKGMGGESKSEVQGQGLDTDNVEGTQNEKNAPKIYTTSITETILLRREVAPAEPAIISFKIDSKGDPDSEPFPPDCIFLQKMQSIIRGRTINSGNREKFTSFLSLILTLPAIVVVNSYY